MTASGRSAVSTSWRTTSSSRPPACAPSCSATGRCPPRRRTWLARSARTPPLLVYPGGDEDSFRPSWETGQVGFAGRTGFVELALEHGVPIVPVVALGGQETALFLGRGKRVARGLQLNRFARLKVLPVVLGPPFGITVLDAPGRIPLPSKITIRVMPPIHLREKLGRNPDIEAGYRLVASRMQRTLTRLNNQRRIPVV